MRINVRMSESNKDSFTKGYDFLFSPTKCTKIIIIIKKQLWGLFGKLVGLDHNFMDQKMPRSPYLKALKKSFVIKSFKVILKLGSFHRLRTPIFVYIRLTRSWFNSVTVFIATRKYAGTQKVQRRNLIS